MPSHWSLTKINEAKAQRLYAATKPKDATPSRTYVNSTMRESYTGNNMGTSRDGAYDANSISSHGELRV